MKLSRETKALLPELEEACRTSRDNEGIGRYYHVPLYEVLAIRLTMETPIAVQPRISHEEQASRELLKATRKLFRKWEVRHRFQKGAAQILIPAGYIPEDTQCSR